MRCHLIGKFYLVEEESSVFLNGSFQGDLGFHDHSDRLKDLGVFLQSLH